MSECYLEVADNALCHCGDCDWTGSGKELDMIHDIQERIDPGSIVPAGECPDCGALAYLDKTLEAEDARAKKEDAGRAMLAVLKYIDKTNGVVASGGARSKPTIAQLNEMWDRVKVVIFQAETAGIKAEG